MTVTLRQLLVELYTKLHEEDKRLHMAWNFWLLLTARILWPAPWAFFAVFLLGFAKVVVMVAGSVCLTFAPISLGLPLP